MPLARRDSISSFQLSQLVGHVYLSAAIVAKMIANDLSNFGSQKFKLTGFKALTGIMNAGAMGCEIKISGKLPSSRAKSWRFHKGYLKKTGYVSDFLVDKAQEMVTLKTEKHNYPYTKHQSLGLSVSPSDSICRLLRLSLSVVLLV